MNKKIMLLGIICVAFCFIGCNNIVNKNKLQLENDSKTEKKNIDKSDRDLQASFVDKIIQDDDCAYVREITCYFGKSFAGPQQYQYFVFNKDKSTYIDCGIMTDRCYTFERINNNIVRGKRGTGTGCWEVVYYNQKNGEKTDAIENVLIEIDEFILYPYWENNQTYIVIGDMFDNEKIYGKYKVIDGLFSPGSLITTYKDNVITIAIDSESYEKQFDIEDIIKR